MFGTSPSPLEQWWLRNHRGRNESCYSIWFGLFARSLITGGGTNTVTGGEEKQEWFGFASSTGRHAMSGKVISEAVISWSVKQ